MSKEYLISDTHFGHINIIKYCSRPFNDIHHMNKVLTENWNSMVKPNDVVYHLGDFSWGDPVKYLPRLNGKIHLILGNHDKFRLCEKAGFESVENSKILERNGKKIILFHYPDVSRFKESFDLFFHGHIHNNGYHNEFHRYEIVPNMINLSVEMTDYKPVLLENYL